MCIVGCFWEPQVLKEVQTKVFWEPTNADRKRAATKVNHLLEIRH